MYCLTRLKLGFTLVEVLVVLTILAVLAALLFPALAGARESGRQIRCLANLRQLGGAIYLYLQDYDQKFPYGLDPFDRYYPEQWLGWSNPWTGESYYEQVLRLIAVHPTQTNLDQVLLPYYSGEPEVWHCPDDRGWPRSPGNSSLFHTFGSSYIYRTELALSHIPLPSLAHPSETNLLVDAVAWHRKGPRTVNLLYTDGHVKNVREEEYWAAHYTSLYW
ncbi:MAG TPA: prepilin-type N-terminal cleavage/methylation domain-containing protein [Armatimonadetes bacterium]|nr:prepilin-type N-terminal cleavage/methylation domain-containing protein [Armatimonadota bacterium]